jgi:ABC-2 type transport system permease protein
VPRVLEQDKRLRPLMRRFDERRLKQAAFVERWAWASPGLALVLTGERLAGTDTASQVRYLREVDAFEDRWRAFLVPKVMDRRGLSPADIGGLPRAGPPPKNSPRS